MGAYSKAAAVNFENRTGEGVQIGVQERSISLDGVSYSMESYSESDDCLVLVKLANGDFAYIYTCDGNFVMPEEFDEAEVLIVAGGGGGGQGTGAGGGGAGGLVHVTSMELVSGESYAVVVGVGGAGGTASGKRGENGTNSSFNGQVANGGGGGGGGTGSGVGAGRSGGSGGGNGADNKSNGGNGVGSQGNNGGVGGGKGQPGGGGGGGAHSPGVSGGNNSGGNGGRGLMFSLSGDERWYAGGGGGTTRTDEKDPEKQGQGGSDIGGDGNNKNDVVETEEVNEANGGDGYPNSGSGGGASRTGSGGDGADGVVIIKLSARATPVKWKDFSIDLLASSRAVRLSWSTSKEWESSHFEIERSVNGVEDFKKVGEVSAVGWSDQVHQYTFVDQELPHGGERAYYRLKQVDLNNDFGFSKVLSIDVPASTNAEAGVWRVYPNPSVNDVLEVALAKSTAYHEEALRFRFVSSFYSTEVFWVQGLEDFSAFVKREFAKIPSGLWVFEICWGNRVEHIKVIKK
ncbi:hypothetical protein GCM10028791_29830 [Echinicola sediminis]